MCVRSVAAFLFPIFASYKALKANDQTQLTPWLMYWVVIACVITVENFLGWFLNLYIPKDVSNIRLPLYQEVKAVFLLWMVLPQTQVSSLPCPMTHDRVLRISILLMYIRTF